MKVDKILYIEPGKQGTTHLIDAVKEKIKESDLSTVVVASMNGKSAIKISESIKGSAIVVGVTEFTYSNETKKIMKKLGITHIEKADLPIQDRKEMRQTLSWFGDGMKAALEVASIAAEKEVAKENVIAVAGGKRGLDTAIVVRPTPPTGFSDPDPKKRMAVLEFIVLPLRKLSE